MAVYLKKFETHTQYENYINGSGAILPNVSLIEETNGVEYSPYVDPYNGHAYVDLGLPSGTKWATMNVGANSETDFGNYYQYGKGADTFQVTSGQSDYNGIEDPLAASADTATQVWGGSWHMPTWEQFGELSANTTYQYVTNYNGTRVSGATFTAQNGNVLFLPACGYYDASTGKIPGFAVKEGCYRSSSPAYNIANAWAIQLSSDGKSKLNSYRNSGCSIRAVVG